MKLVSLAILVVAAAAGAVAAPRFLEKRTDQMAMRETPITGLPVNETRGVQGASDVVTTDPNDPFQTKVSSSRSSVTAIPASLSANGITDTTIVVTVRNEEGALVAGAPVNLESSRGQQDTLEVIRGITGADGQAIFLVRSLAPGTLIITAYVGTKVLDQRATVKFIDPPADAAAINARIIWIGLGAILVIIFFQYLFARTVLAARRREEQELFFHHDRQLGRSGVAK